MKDYSKELNYLHTCDSKMLDEVYREVFQLGYKQAEKDLALTVEDLYKLNSIIAELALELTEKGVDYHQFDEDAEIVRRFNEWREWK